MSDLDLDFSVCCIKGCEKPSLALGLCSKHWRRNKLYGSPVAIKKHSGMFIGKTQLERFDMQVKKHEIGCWEWVGGKDKDGYGSFMSEHLGQRFQRAHRWSYAYHNNTTIPDGMSVCHSCDNPSCVNPDHLWLGSTKENQQDKWSKGRGGMLRGELLPQAILTEDQVRLILIDPRPSSRIAADYGVSAQTISSIKNRDSWSHINDIQPVKAKRISPRKGVSDKITPEIVKDIRSGKLTGKEYSEKYGITQQTVCDIRKRRSWSHIED